MAVLLLILYGFYFEKLRALSLILAYYVREICRIDERGNRTYEKEELPIKIYTMAA